MSTKNAIKQTLLNHLPNGAYDVSVNSNITKEVDAEAGAIASCFERTQSLLTVLDEIPAELINQYERSVGLPLLCGQSTVGSDDASRIAEIKRVQKEGHIKLNDAGFLAMFAKYGQQVVSVTKRQPTTCLASCTQPLNTPRLRFKPIATLKKPITVKLACLQHHYLPACLMLDIIEEE